MPVRSDLNCALHPGRLLSCSLNIRLAWKTGRDNLAYFRPDVSAKVKEFANIEFMDTMLLLSSTLKNGPNKPECLSLAGFLKPSLMFVSKAGTFKRVEHISGLALLASNRKTL